MPRLRRGKRQLVENANSDVTANDATAPAETTTDTTLDFDSSITTNPTSSIDAPALTGSGNPTTLVVTTTPTSGSVATSSSSANVNSTNPNSGASSGSSAVSSSGGISTGAVIGAITGSLSLLALVILFVFWHSRRSVKQRKGSVQKTRNWERRKSKREMWKSLEGDGSVDGHGSGAYSAFGGSTTAMRMKPMPSPTGKKEMPQLSPLPFESKEWKLGGTPSPISDSNHSQVQQVYPKPPPPPLAHREPEKAQQATYQQIQHPYATASSESPDSAGDQEDDASFYSMSSPAIITSPSNSTPASGKSHNPFFTAHPSSHDGPERWGSVGKERAVLHSPPMQGTSTSSNNETLRSHGSGGSRAMESLIAALDLNGSGSIPSSSISIPPQPSSSSTTTLTKPHPLNRSLHGHMSTVSVASTENPFEFDDAYDHEIRYSPTNSSHRHLSAGESLYAGMSTGTSWEGEGVSPGQFPMPPR